MREELTYALRLARIKQLLLELYDPLEVDAWLVTPQSFLQGRRPAELLHSEVGYLEVCAIVHRVLDGAFI